MSELRSLVSAPESDPTKLRVARALTSDGRPLRSALRVSASVPALGSPSASTSVPTSPLVTFHDAGDSGSASRMGSRSQLRGDRGGAAGGGGGSGIGSSGTSSLRPSRRPTTSTTVASEADSRIGSGWLGRDDEEDQREGGGEGIGSRGGTRSGTRSGVRTASSSASSSRPPVEWREVPESQWRRGGPSYTIAMMAAAVGQVETRLPEQIERARLPAIPVALRGADRATAEAIASVLTSQDRRRRRGSLELLADAGVRVQPGADSGVGRDAGGSVAEPMDFRSLAHAASATTREEAQRLTALAVGAVRRGTQRRPSLHLGEAFV